MRMEAKPLIAARLAYVHKEVVCCQSLVTLHNCSLHLGSRRFFQPLQVQTSPDPSPPARPTHHPTYTGNDSTHVVDSPWRPPLLPVVAVRHTKAALSCTVLSDSPVTHLPTNHCFRTTATN
jgi:hypothetical protein